MPSTCSSNSDRPGDRILGLSKPARVVELFARSLQVQERLTEKIPNEFLSLPAPRSTNR